MLSDQDFSGDTEFRKLLTRRTDVNLALAALELARDASPKLDFAKPLAWIEQRGRELRGPVARAESEPGVLEAIAECLSGKYGLRGDADAYQRADGSYLNRVIETGRGIPISLSVLYMAVAREAGVELHGVAAPMHFLTRYESTEGPLFCDAFSGGQVLNQDECLEWLQSLTDLEAEAILPMLEPAAPREIIVRMLNNLKALHAKQRNWPAAWRVQCRLAALQPASYEQRRDLALLAVKSNRAGQAIDLLEVCLKNCGQDERPMLQRQLLEAQRQLAQWN